MADRISAIEEAIERRDYLHGRLGSGDATNDIEFLLDALRESREELREAVRLLRLCREEDDPKWGALSDFLARHPVEEEPNG